MKRARQSVKPSKDKQVFSKTAKKTKKINIDPGEWRGGIRL